MNIGLNRICLKFLLSVIFLSLNCLITVAEESGDLSPISLILNNTATKAENVPVGSTMVDNVFTLNQGTQYVGSISEMSECYKGSGMYLGDRVNGGSFTFSLKQDYRHNIARVVIWASQAYNDNEPIAASITINGTDPVAITSPNKDGASGYFNIDCYIPADMTDKITVSSSAKVLLQGIIFVFDGTEAVAGNVESITIVPSTLKIPVGKEIDLSLKPKVSPTWAINHGVEWSSSNESVVSVTDDGVIKALKTGTSKITITSLDNPSIAAVCNVTVANVAPTSVSINPTKATIGVGGSLQFTAIVSPEEASQDVTWTIFDPYNTNSISITETGLVTANSESTNKVRARATALNSDKNITARVDVVSFLKIDSLAMAQEQIVMYENEQYQLTAEYNPLGASNTSLRWQSLNPEICSIDDNGKIQANKAGQTTITAETTDGSYLRTSCYVTVKQNAVSSIDEVAETNLHITADDNRIKVSGITSTPTVYLYSTMGQLVTSTKVVEGSVTISVPHSSVYLLRIGDRSFKLAIR